MVCDNWERESNLQVNLLGNSFNGEKRGKVPPRLVEDDSIGASLHAAGALHSPTTSLKFKEPNNFFFANTRRN
ncbi:hypothetical protein WN51_00941 [Melipona quadrifasciata]|uniref:Uncharacterized protein n=1 Tax=Melipona quadrifasciata TaxID=166423 RepID=A0A0M8ZVP0_9HYME|nr:hypothetical protein WN51_00941 [Melipona quadrifasciata]